MKFTATLLLVLCLTANYSFGQFIVLSETSEISNAKQTVITVLKPPHVDVQQHENIARYGILGPESFKTSVTFQLVNEDEILVHGATITLRLTDSEIFMLNAMQESSFRILCTEREVASDCLGSPYGTIRDYTYLYGEPGTAAITESHLQDSTVLLKDIYPSSMIVTVKCNSIRKSHLREVKPAFTTNCISFLQPIMEMHTMERVQIEIVDRGAALLYGNFIQIVNPFPEVLEGTEYARVRLERVILEGENNHAPVYWIKDAVPVPLSQQDFLKN